MDEVERHRGRGPDEILEPLNESGERTQLDDAEVGLGTGGHRLDASPGGTEEQELRAVALIIFAPCPLPSTSKPASTPSKLRSPLPAGARTGSSSAPISLRAARRPPQVRSRCAAPGSTSPSSCSFAREAATSFSRRPRAP